MLLDHCCEFGLLLLLSGLKKFLKKGTPRYLLLTHPGSGPGQIWPKHLNECAGPWALYPNQVSYEHVVKADYVFPYIYMH